MTDVPYLGAEALREVIRIHELLDAVESAYRDVAAGRDRSPLRSHVNLPDGDLLLMPGIREGASGSTVKLVTVTPENAGRGLPTIHAVVVWFDALTGAPRALLDGAAITAMRTGAASGVATRLLARPDARTLALFGVGGQAEWQLRAVMAARPIERVRVFARTPGSREDFARRMTDALQVDVEAASSPDAALRGADVVCCATTSSAPIFDDGAVEPGTHVNAIGAFRLGMVELPPALFGRAALTAIDSRQAALAEAGDLVAAIEGGILAETDLVEIGTVAPGFAAGRDASAITVFKSVGLAIQDVAAAELAVARMLPGASQP